MNNALDPKLTELLLKTRKSATAGFETKQWKALLEALGFTVTLGKERTTVVSFTAARGGHTFTINKEAGYRRITFYRMHQNLTAAGCDLKAECCAALGLDTPEVEKHKKAISRGANDLHRTGTCQCCFNPQKVSKGGGKLMSLHGYERPGVGYIIGDCMGQGHQPFEVSCEMTKLMRKHVEGMKANAQDFLAKLNANEVETLRAHIRTNLKENDKYGYPRTKYVYVDVARGAEASPNPYFLDQPWEKVPSFEDLRESEIRAVERRIEQMTSDINFLTEKIDGWVQVWPE